MSSSRRTPALIGGDPTFSEPVYVTRALAPDRIEFEMRLATIFESHWFTNNGPLVRELEERLADHLGVGLCAAFCNGTIALQVALRSLDLSGEIITTPFTFPATVHAIDWNGLTPVFCDIDPETYNLDVERASELVTARTTALVPVHVFGNPCDVRGIERLAADRGLKVVYDGAHAFGVWSCGRPIGMWGDLTTFSFHATKVFHTAEGGAITGGDRRRFERLALLRNFGIVNENEVDGVGVNGKLSELHAALGLALIEPAERESAARARLTSLYRERLEKVAGVGFQRMSADTIANHAYFAIEVDPLTFGLTRDEVHEALKAENIVTRRYFAPLCSENPAYRHIPTARPEQLPNAHRVASRVLCLPIHGGLDAEAIHRIVEALVSIREEAPAVRRSLAKLSTG